MVTYLASPAGDWITGAIMVVDGRSGLALAATWQGDSDAMFLGTLTAVAFALKRGRAEAVARAPYSWPSSCPICSGESSCSWAGSTPGSSRTIRRSLRWNSGLSHLPQPGRRAHLGHGGGRALLLLAYPGHHPPLAGGRHRGPGGVLPLSARCAGARARSSASWGTTRPSSGWGCGIIRLPRWSRSSSSFGLGLALYVALGSHAASGPGGPACLLVVLVLVGVYFASVYGPPPPNMTTVGGGRHRLRPAGRGAGRVGRPARLARGARAQRLSHR